MTDTSREAIEREIHDARYAVADRIAAIESRFNQRKSVRDRMSAHSVGLAIAAAGAGFLIGMKMPKRLVQLLLVGVPAVVLVRKFSQNESEYDPLDA